MNFNEIESGIEAGELGCPRISLKRKRKRNWGKYMADISFTQFAYLDTNIFSHLAKNKHLWNHLLSYLLQNDLCLSLSSANLAELADAGFLHDDIVDFLLCMPSVVIKTWDIILKEEVAAHPKSRSQTLLLDPIIRLLLEKNGHETLKSWFSSPKLAKARREQLIYAKQIKMVHKELKGNFPPAKSGEYERHQADEFSSFIVMQWLVSTHRNFLTQFTDNPENFNTDVFCSIKLFGLVNFYKYYLGKRDVKKTSDFGDFAHLCHLPYCQLVIIERDLCNVLNQIKSNHNILQSTEITNIDFFKGWK